MHIIGTNLCWNRSALLLSKLSWRGWKETLMCHSDLAIIVEFLWFGCSVNGRYWIFIAFQFLGYGTNGQSTTSNIYDSRMDKVPSESLIQVIRGKITPFREGPETESIFENRRAKYDLFRILSELIKYSLYINQCLELPTTLIVSCTLLSNLKKTIKFCLLNY